MKRAMVFGILLSASGFSYAEELPDVSPYFKEAEINLNLTQRSVDTLSSKFLEYRDVPNGVSLPFLRFQGNTKSVRYDFVAKDLRQDDQAFSLRLKTSAIRLDGEYTQIPHRFGNAGRSVLTQVAPDQFALSDTVQKSLQSSIEAQYAKSRAGVNFAFLNGLLEPSLASARFVDLKLKRERGQLNIALTPNKPINLNVAYFRERRVGDRAAAGTSFGFGNIVENPEPVHYVTQDISGDASYERSWGVIRAGVGYNWLENRFETITWDNPFRFTDATDASAYSAPGSGSIGGASIGRMALPPDNTATRGNLGAIIKLPAKTRLSGNVSLSRWRQNSSPFIPFTTNTAIVSPFNASDPSTLPARQLDGKINVLSQSYFVSSKPMDRLSLTARFRSYDLDNKTPRISFEEGYTRFDAVWEDIPRISVPYEYKNNRFDATVGYDVGRVGLEVAYKNIGFHRAFRETEKTTENGVTGAVNFRVANWASVRMSYERADRNFDEYDFERAEDATFLDPGPPVNLPALRRFDQANKNSNRVNGQLQLTPRDDLTFAFSYLKTSDDYDESTHGLLKASYETFSTDADYAPNDRFSIYASYTREKIGNFQRGRQSGATPSTDPAADWTSDVDDAADSFALGGRYVLIQEKLTFDASARHQTVNGNNDLVSPPGGTPDVAFGIPIYDDTKWTTVTAQFKYTFSEAWSLVLGGWLEDYEIQDAATTDLPNYLPGGLFLAAQDGNYQARGAFTQVAYRW